MCVCVCVCICTGVRACYISSFVGPYITYRLVEDTNHGLFEKGDRIFDNLISFYKNYLAVSRSFY